MEDGWGNRYKIFLSKSQTCLSWGLIHSITLFPSKYSMFSTRFKLKEVREYEGIKIIRKSVDNFIGRHYFKWKRGKCVKTQRR